MVCLFDLNLISFVRPLAGLISALTLVYTHGTLTATLSSNGSVIGSPPLN